MAFLMRQHDESSYLPPDGHTSGYFVALDLQGAAARQRDAERWQSDLSLYARARPAQESGELRTRSEMRSLTQTKSVGEKSPFHSKCPAGVFSNND
jgi:hypothetical protein